MASTLSSCIGLMTIKNYIVPDRLQIGDNLNYFFTSGFVRAQE